MTRRPITVTVNFVLILVNLIIWLGLGIIIAVNAYPALSIPPILKGIMAAMSMGMAGILLILFIFLVRGSHKGFYFTLAFFGVTALLTIFDDVGVSDIVVLIMNIIPIILMILDRKWYLGERSPAEPLSETHET
jgi:hypothetical protein